MYSAALHVLSCFKPDEPLEQMWSRSVRSLVAGPSRWLKDAVYYAREVLGWPASLPCLGSVSLECKLRRAMKVKPS
eukprot:6469293-Amphidinium_carterae.1